MCTRAEPRRRVTRARARRCRFRSEALRLDEFATVMKKNMRVMEEKLEALGELQRRAQVHARVPLLIAGTLVRGRERTRLVQKPAEGRQATEQGA